MEDKDMKDVFMSGDPAPIYQLLAYIQNDLGVKEARKWNFIGYPVIDVPKDKYEYVLLHGKDYACQNNLAVCWLDHYNERRGPIDSCDIGYAFLPETKISGEDLSQYKDKTLWGVYRERTPEVIMEYFDAMKNYLQVDNLYLDTHLGDRAMRITAHSTDYDRMIVLLNEFVEKYGYGPFSEIRNLSFTGKLEDAILNNEKHVK